VADLEGAGSGRLLPTYDPEKIVCYLPKFSIRSILIGTHFGK